VRLVRVKIHPAIDRLLGGGLEPGVLTHVYGPPASGKTNLALLASVSASKKGRVIYIDPEGGFSVERIKQIAGADFTKILNKILLIKPTSFDEQKVAVDKTEEIVSKGDVSLVVVDSIAMLYRIEEDRDIRALGRVMAKLLRIARKYELPVLMTNQVYCDIETKAIVPVGGEINRYWCKDMLELVYDNGRRTAVLRRHRHQPEGLRAEFTITEKGIEEVGSFAGAHPR